MAKEKVPTNLNLDRLTREYIYPDFSSGEPDNLRVPTAEELTFLGVEATRGIREWLFSEQVKVDKLIDELNQELDTLSAEKLDFGLESRSDACDWHGLGYVEVPDGFVGEVIEHGNEEMVDQVRRSRRAKVHSCRFGKHIAGWCSKSPIPCQNENLYDCYGDSTIVSIQNTIMSMANARGIEASDNISISNPKSECPYHEACTGYEPFINQTCVFASERESAVSACKEHLNTLRRDGERRKDLIGAYLKEVERVLEGDFTEPSVRLDLLTKPSLGKVGEPGFEISYDPKTDDMQMAVYVNECVLPDTESSYCKVARVTRRDVEGKPFTEILFLDNDTHLTGKVYVPMSELVALISNSDYRAVWIRLADKTNTGFTEESLNRVFDEIFKSKR